MNAYHQMVAVHITVTTLEGAIFVLAQKDIYCKMRGLVKVMTKSLHDSTNSSCY